MAKEIRALLVEDSPGDARLVIELLREVESAGIELSRAASLAAAARELSNGAFDVVVLDLGLPDSQGLDTLARLRELAPDVPVVVMTGLREPELAVLALQASAQEYLIKDDLAPEPLHRAILQAIERRARENELRRLAEDAAAGEAALRVLLTDDVDGFAVVDPHGRVCFANPAAFALLGCSEGDTLAAIAYGPTAPARIQEVAVAGGRTVEIRVAATRWRGVPAYLVAARDVTAHKRAEAELERANLELRSATDDLARLACVDPLTGSFNRRGLERLLRGEIGRASRAGQRLAVLMIDCDDFKLVNERHGHAAGDRALVELCERMRRHLRPSDHLARVGGDEFLVLVEEAQRGESERVAERLRRAVESAPFATGRGSVELTISVAVAALAGPDAPARGASGASIAGLLDLTERQLARCKARGKNRVFSEAELDPPSEASPRGERRLHVALQRMVDLSSGAAQAFELAAVDGGDLWPPLRVRADLRGLDACLRALERASGNGLRPHFNVTASALAAGAIEPLLALSSRGACVEIEADRAALPAGLGARVEALRGAGMSIAVENASSVGLDTLFALAPQWLKVSPARRSLARDEAAAERIGAIVRVARALGARVIADGCDTREELDLVRQLGVDLAQGDATGGWVDLGAVV